MRGIPFFWSITGEFDGGCQFWQAEKELDILPDFTDELFDDIHMAHLILL